MLNVNSRSGNHGHLGRLAGLLVEVDIKEEQENAGIKAQQAVLGNLYKRENAIELIVQVNTVRIIIVHKLKVYSELQYIFKILNNFTEDHNFNQWGPWSPCPRTCLMSYEKQEHFKQRQKRQCASLNVDEGLNNGYGMSCPALESNMDLYFKTQTCELPKCKGVYKITVFWRVFTY